jgi:hypothetical protein
MQVQMVSVLKSKKNMIVRQFSYIIYFQFDNFLSIGNNKSITIENSK